MFIHLVVLAKFDGQTIAYHFSSEDWQKVLRERKRVRGASEISPAAYSVHVLKTKEPGFMSAQKMDAYFQDVSVYADLNDFFDALGDLIQLSAEDVASYLVRKHALSMVDLQRTLYFIYAESLISSKKPLFKNRFVVFEEGPVDREVYRLQTHHRAKMIESHGLEKKIMADVVSPSVVEQLDTGARDYQSKFGSAWEDNENPTHRPGTPWRVARARGGRNEPITDEDILKYHEAERI
ncbi:Panacea domain-containing protein [Levilactobacillus cerevisiae]|uniref:Panacea domain-containing protein n=1 Tax=Levilactobacillus cerevisiae TaxID=1704076 RepID=UPI00345E552C